MLLCINGAVAHQKFDRTRFSFKIVIRSKMGARRCDVVQSGRIRARARSSRKPKSRSLSTEGRRFGLKFERRRRRRSDFVSKKNHRS